MTASVPPWSTSAHAREVVGELIHACRDGEHAFERAARAVDDPVLRAELTQYSVQRREFVLELQEALSAVGDRADDDPPHFSGNHGRWDGLERAAEAGNRAGLLHECESFDLVALEAYRHALQSSLPYAIDGVSHSHFYAITRIQSRLQCLADLAGGSSPIDNA
jgi:uncharacterized protein (TIGR02284 family)